MNVIVNAKVFQIVKQRNTIKERAYVEIEKLLGSSVNDDSDEVAQFQADPFISDQFCMIWPEQKHSKQGIKGPAETVPFKEHTRCSSLCKMDDNHNRQGCASREGFILPWFDIRPNPPFDESKIQPADSKKIKTKELDSLLKESFAAYDQGQYGLAAVKYKMALEMITDITPKLDIEHINEDVVCYMLCLSLLGTGQLNNLSEAVELLVALEKRSAHVFPAVYYALSKAHHQHYRFALALKATEKGLAFLEGDVELTEYRIPGSDVTLKESTKDGLSVLLAAMKDECSKWHPPDAVCCMGECLPSSRWYAPSRDIYFSDPAFNGMVVLTCNNARNPCTMKFHQACWKTKKDQLSALKKLSDKDVIGYECFTPNCEYGQNIRSLITRVEVYGDDAKLKTHIEPPANPVQWMKRRSLHKGAIPKQQVKLKRHSEKIRRPIASAVPRSSGKEVMGENRAEKAWRLVKLDKLRKNNFGIKPGYEWRPDMEMYGNPQMIEIGDYLGGPIFENDCPQLVAIKTFIFTYFYEYIKENGCVKKTEISQKWEEDKFIFDNHSEVLHGETDICEFLLQSYKLVSLGDRIGIAENLPELYAIVRSEVCGCLKFLLADSLHSRPMHIQDNISHTMISDYEEKQNKLSTVVMDCDAKIDATISLDKIQQVNMRPPVPVSPDSPQPRCQVVISPENLSTVVITSFQEAYENADPNTRSSMTQNASTVTEPKSTNDSAHPEEPVGHPVIIRDCRLEPDNSIKLEATHNTNNHPERSENNSIGGKLGTDPLNICLTDPQPVLNTQTEVDIVEVGVDSEDKISHGVCNLPQELKLANDLLEGESDEDSNICDLDCGDCVPDDTTDRMSDMKQDTPGIKPRLDATVREVEYISVNNDASDGAAPPRGVESPADDNNMTAAEFPETSLIEKQDWAVLTETKMIETSERGTSAIPTSQGQDILAESNVQKIENDLAAMVKTVAQLKSVLEQNQARSENHAQILQQELINHKMLSQERMTELVKDFSRLETRCARLESEKSEIMHKYKQCELDLRRTNEENVALTLKNNEWMHKYDKLSEDKADIEHNFDLLLKEKSLIENNLEIVQRERDKMDKKLEKLSTRLKDMSSKDSESMCCLRKEQGQSEQQIAAAARSSERKLKLESLNHEFSINKYALEKAFEKCYDHISMLKDTSELVTSITGQQFVMGGVEEAWERTDYDLRHTIVQYKEDYLKLKALLESDKEIENLNDMKLPTLNIVFPSPPNLSGLYRTGKAKLIRHQMTVMPNQWLMPGGYYQDPRYLTPTPSSFYPGRNLEPRMNDASNIPAETVLLNNHCPQKFYPNDDADNNLRQKGRNGDVNGAGLQREGNTTPSGPIIIAQKRDFDGRFVPDNFSHYDAENYDDRGGAKAICTGAFNGGSQNSVNKRSTPLKKIGRDLLIEEMRRKFVGVPELDLLESVQNVRKRHNGTLSGMRVQDIIQESEQFVIQLQAKHMAYYLPSKQMLPPERMHLQPNKSGHRKLPPSMPLGQQKRIRGGAQEQANKLANISGKVPAVVPAAVKMKRAWLPVTSGLVEWKKNQEESECTICFESMNVYDKRAPVYTLPCQHSFHTTCIKKWLVENSICPICRIHCTMDDEFPPLPA